MDREDIQRMIEKIRALHAATRDAMQDVLARVFFLAFDPRGVFCFGNVSDLLCESSLRVVGCVYALLHVYLCSMNLVGRGDLLI
jgi:hypothetical protein